jgi:hypothetical protein
MAQKDPLRARKPYPHSTGQLDQLRPAGSRRTGTQSHQAVGPWRRDAPDLDMAAVRTSADLETIQQPHGDVCAAIRRAKHLFKVRLDQEARS